MEAVSAGEIRTDKVLFRMFQFAFCCRHGHLSRVFTIQKRTYKVCLDCGQEFVSPDPYRTQPPGVGGYDRTPLKGLGTLTFR
jgi:hypothetical protein